MLFVFDNLIVRIVYSFAYPNCLLMIILVGELEHFCFVRYYSHQEYLGYEGLFAVNLTIIVSLFFLELVNANIILVIVIHDVQKWK